MSLQVALGLGVVVATMAVAVLGALLRRQSNEEAANAPSLPRGVFIVLVSGGAVVLAAALVGLLVVLIP